MPAVRTENATIRKIITIAITLADLLLLASFSLYMSIFFLLLPAISILASLFMVRFVVYYFECSVDLLEQNHPHHLMRESHFREG